MNFRITREPWTNLATGAIVIPLFEDEDPSQGFPAKLDSLLGGLLAEVRETGEWKGRFGQLMTVHRPVGLSSSRAILFGAGKQESLTVSALRRLMAVLMCKLREQDLPSVAVLLRDDQNTALAVQAAVEGLLVGSFDVGEFKTDEKNKAFSGEILLAWEGGLPGDESEITRALGKGEILGSATNLARSMVNQPANRFHPVRLAETATEISGRFGLEIEIFGEPEMRRRQMNCILAVSQGSSQPARFVILRHLKAPDPARPPVVLVGKGVTFDSGGLSLKPAQSMEDMKNDKAGACAVLAAMQAIAQLQLPVNVVALLPAVENLPSGRAQKPGDVIRSMSGKTVEVLNTDAEGRLILADALHFAKSLEPDCVVDIATLTGAVVVALGQIQAGIFSNDDRLFDDLMKSAALSGERFWRLPLDDDYRREIESHVADIKNMGSRWGGAITGAKFLQEFVGEIPWCHIDMAGVDAFPENDELKGPTGFGVRTLAEFVMLRQGVTAGTRIPE